ncbi:hypothetical protein GWD52_09955 [Enterobacteriaceae bacterium 4M9]|nr:hypothetical protein [Enterobacteriaceae bacterium 4M9]
MAYLTVAGAFPPMFKHSYIKYVEIALANQKDTFQQIISKKFFMFPYLLGGIRSISAAAAFTIVARL